MFQYLIFMLELYNYWQILKWKYEKTSIYSCSWLTFDGKDTNTQIDWKLKRKDDSS